MNKVDKITISIILLILLLVIIFQKLNSNNLNKEAIIYYENKIVKKINLNINKKQEFDVQGYNGNIHIIAKKGKIKVTDEISEKNLCSKQGYISSSHEMIVCLPNKIVIKIEDKDELDTILRWFKYGF